MDQFYDRINCSLKRRRVGYSRSHCRVSTNCGECDSVASWSEIQCDLTKSFTHSHSTQQSLGCTPSVPCGESDGLIHLPGQQLSCNKSRLDKSSEYIILPQSKHCASNTRVEKALKKSSQNSPWVDIFASMKLLLFMRLPESEAVSDSEIQMIIVTADDSFEKNFWFPNASIRNSTVESLVGPGTSLDTITKLKRSMRYGTSSGEYINLYRMDQVPLCCFVSLRVLSGCHPQSSGPDSDRFVMAVMTINSSSVVGNMAFSGFGHLLNHPISKEGKALILQGAAGNK